MTPHDQSPERLVACALIRDGLTHHGFRSHSDLRGSLGDADPYTANHTDHYGFWTSKDRFVSRGEGNRVAAVAGQCQVMQREMLSSDVTWEPRPAPKPAPSHLFVGRGCGKPFTESREERRNRERRERKARATGQSPASKTGGGA